MSTRALVAQGIEHRFPKPCVAGSIPAGGTTLDQVNAPPDDLWRGVTLRVGTRWRQLRPARSSPRGRGRRPRPRWRPCQREGMVGVWLTRRRPPNGPDWGCWTCGRDRPCGSAQDQLARAWQAPNERRHNEAARSPDWRDGSWQSVLGKIERRGIRPHRRGDAPRSVLPVYRIGRTRPPSDRSGRSAPPPRNPVRFRHRRLLVRERHFRSSVRRPGQSIGALVSLRSRSWCGRRCTHRGRRRWRSRPR